MTENTPVTAVVPGSIFISHAHEDSSFAHRLARDLGEHGVRVWIDSAEIGVGDSLLEKISGAISEMDYLGVVISRHSAESDWVTREVELAMGTEVAGHRVRVLPLVIRGGVLPAALEGRVFSDFTSEPKYPAALRDVLARLEVGTGPQPPGDRLTELAESNALLRTALSQLQRDGLSEATAQALESGRVDDFDLAEFLSLAARRVSGDRLCGLARAAVGCIDAREVGHDALSYCLGENRLTEDQLSQVAGRMVDVTTDAAVVWCHSQLTSSIRIDFQYHSFLNRHAEVVIRECYDELVAYLTEPNRGPGEYNVDSFEIVVGRAEDAAPLRRRWIEWIDNRYFDGVDRDGEESAEIHYKILNERWGSPAFADIVEATHRHVYLLLKARTAEHVNEGLYHLTSMVSARYRGAGWALDHAVGRVYDLAPEQRIVMHRIEDALRDIEKYYKNPSQVTERELSSGLSRIHEADRSGVTGFWAS